jgi:hypothetical protein
MTPLDLALPPARDGYIRTRLARVPNSLSGAWSHDCEIAAHPPDVKPDRRTCAVDVDFLATPSMQSHQGRNALLITQGGPSAAFRSQPRSSRSASMADGATMHTCHSERRLGARIRTATYRSPRRGRCVGQARSGRSTRQLSHAQTKQCPWPPGWLGDQPAGVIVMVAVTWPALSEV